MKSAEFSKSASTCEVDSKTAEGCDLLCGMCAPCVFAPQVPGSPRRLWKASDRFNRRFILDLLLRCGNTRVLESIHSVLSVTSWPLSNYARSRTPGAPRRVYGRGASPALDGKPLGVDTRKIWEWFSNSPPWIQTRYLCRILSRCDPELLRMVFNLSSVLLIRQKRGFAQCNVSSYTTNQTDEENDEDSEDPALIVIPGSTRSVSGVSRYRDFIGCLPVYLSKRILGLLEEPTLRLCQKVCKFWHLLASETMEEMKFRILFQNQIKSMMMRFKAINIVDPTYANFVEVPIPTQDDETENIHPSVQKVRPFEAAYANIKTKTVQMEERNVYCGAYFTKVLLNKEDSHRVVDYRGGDLMATGSRGRVVQMFYVRFETKVVSLMKGHVASVRAVLLYQDRNLVITGSADASIRCWNLKTDMCETVLYGHTASITCLDVHADRLVSGAKDCRVKVWNLNKWKPFEGFNFKHPASIRCVKTSAANVYSSCDRGLVKIWNLEKASLIRVINAHKTSVRCLFLDKFHLLSGDINGQVMAWSTSCQAKECLITFNHPKEVKSVTLVYLRVVTGCVDGIIRIFNFITGDCLRYIRAETETGCLLSLHLNENSILVNTTSSVKLYQFAKVFWDYPGAADPGQGAALAQNGLISKKSGVSRTNVPCSSAVADHMAQITLPNRGIGDGDTKRPRRPELTHHMRFLSTPTKCQMKARHHLKIYKPSNSLMLSEEATSARIKKRGPHHPLTRDSRLLRVSALQRARCMDEVSINMEHNARLRDSWGPHTSPDPLQSDIQPLKLSLHDELAMRAKTCGPTMKRAACENMSSALGQRHVTTAPPSTRQSYPCLCSRKAKPHNIGTHQGITKCRTFSTSTKEEQKYCIKYSNSLPNISASEPKKSDSGSRYSVGDKRESHRPEPN